MRFVHGASTTVDIGSLVFGCEMRGELGADGLRLVGGAGDLLGVYWGLLGPVH